jgi:hypothetical protein
MRTLRAGILVSQLILFKLLASVMQGLDNKLTEQKFTTRMKSSMALD